MFGFACVQLLISRIRIIALGFLMVMVLGGLAWLLRRRRLRPLPPPRPAHEIALEALGTLAGPTADPDGIRRWHFDISEVLGNQYCMFSYISSFSGCQPDSNELKT